MNLLTEIIPHHDYSGVNNNGGCMNNQKAQTLLAWISERELRPNQNEQDHQFYAEMRREIEERIYEN